MSPFFNTCTLHSLADTHLNFASIRDAGTCFDFDFVNHNQPGGRSWSRSEQEGNVAQVLLSIHIYLAFSMFSAVLPMAVGAAAHAGSVGAHVAGQRWTWWSALRSQ